MNLYVHSVQCRALRLDFVEMEKTQNRVSLPDLLRIPNHPSVIECPEYLMYLRVQAQTYFRICDITYLLA
jgi:hypothetical protein